MNAAPRSLAPARRGLPYDVEISRVDLRPGLLKLALQNSDALFGLAVVLLEVAV